MINAFTVRITAAAVACDHPFLFSPLATISLSQPIQSAIYSEWKVIYLIRFIGDTIFPTHLCGEFTITLTFSLPCSHTENDTIAFTRLCSLSRTWGFRKVAIIFTGLSVNDLLIPSQSEIESQQLNLIHFASLFLCKCYWPICCNQELVQWLPSGHIASLNIIEGSEFRQAISRLTWWCQVPWKNARRVNLHPVAKWSTWCVIFLCSSCPCDFLCSHTRTFLVHKVPEEREKSIEETIDDDVACSQNVSGQAWVK